MYDSHPTVESTTQEFESQHSDGVQGRDMDSRCSVHWLIQQNDRRDNRWTRKHSVKSFPSQLLNSSLAFQGEYRCSTCSTSALEQLEPLRISRSKIKHNPSDLNTHNLNRKTSGHVWLLQRGSGALHWEAWATTLGPFKNWRVGSELPCEGKGWTVVLGCVVSLSYIRRRDRGVTSNVMRGPRKKKQKTIPTVWIVLHWLLDLWDPFLWWDFPQLLAWADADKLQPVFFPFFKINSFCFFLLSVLLFLFFALMFVL